MSLEQINIFVCIQCGVEISKRLYESSVKEKCGHEHFKMTIMETDKPSWSPYYPYQKLRRKKILEEYQLSPARCTNHDMALNLDLVYAPVEPRNAVI